MLAASLFAAALAGQAPTAVPERHCDYAETPHGRIYFELFLVFFDRDSSAISPAAAAILDTAARAYAPISDRCILAIYGHADRSGSASYNLALSRRRAAAILAYLRARGVTGAALLEALGETRPLVDTADGAREPQNRRAEILLMPPSRR
jgi:OOP family OmpA-OmpF porin